MNSRRLILTIEFLTMQLNHWVLFLPAMTLMGLMAGLTGSGKPDWSMWALVGLLPFLCFLIRRRQKICGFLRIASGSPCTGAPDSDSGHLQSYTLHFLYGLLPDQLLFHPSEGA